MSQNRITLMTAAAEFRAAGHSWEAVARKLNRQPATCQKWVNRYPKEWSRLYLEAQRQRYDEVSNESLSFLRGLLRSEVEKTQLKSIELVMKYGPDAIAAFDAVLNPKVEGNSNGERPESPEELHINAFRDDVQRVRYYLNRERAEKGLPEATFEQILKQIEQEHIDRERNHADYVRMKNEKPAPNWLDEELKKARLQEEREAYEQAHPYQGNREAPPNAYGGVVLGALLMLAGALAMNWSDRNETMSPQRKQGTETRPLLALRAQEDTPLLALRAHSDLHPTNRINPDRITATDSFPVEQAMSQHGFVRVAAASPPLMVGHVEFNARQTIDTLAAAEKRDLHLLAFPELGLTGYTCHDLFHQKALQSAAIDGLFNIAESTKRSFTGMAIVGLPLCVDDQVFNCAAVLAGGRILGIVPKTYLPTYKEFYDARYFAPSSTAISDRVRLRGDDYPFGTDLLFRADNVDGFTVGVEICEDLWVSVPPSSIQCLHGATVLVNLSASNETIAKANYRRQLVGNQSARCIAAYVYAAAGIGESTQDLVFGGHSIIAENGNILREAPRFSHEGTLIAADVDVDRLRNERAKTTSFHDAVLESGFRKPFRCIDFRAPERKYGLSLLREVEAHPFVPAGQEQLRERCEEIFNIQLSGFWKRLDHIGKPPVAIGISGGLDSTLALLVTCKVFDAIGVGREKIKALTMPGFGTTGRTRGNAIALMNALSVPYREIDIRPMCLAEMKALGHAPFGIPLEGVDLDTLTAKLRNLPADRRSDLTFENIQARVRTNLLMNTAFTIGTGDLSELALGWCTYNADHMSMYNPNISIPKTLVKFLVRWAAENEFDGDARRTLLDIVDTEISPELLPSDADGKIQSTELTIGPYELHDFFLFHFLRYGAPPSKILFLAKRTKFDRDYGEDEIKRWLAVFLKRFFTNQFKRSCLPDGPKVGSISLSPRGDWRMPSDAHVATWLKELEGS